MCEGARIALAEKDAIIRELQEELSTSILVQINRLVDALADARAELAELKKEREL